MVDDLRDKDFGVRFKQYQPLGTEMNYFMMASVKDADKIFLICTPTFEERSDKMKQACGFEALLISNKLVKDITTTKFVPIIRIGKVDETMPICLENRNALILHKNDNYDDKFSMLIENLQG